MHDVKTIDKWDDIPWKQFQSEVFRVQKRIYRESQNGNRPQMHNLQKLLTSSFAAKCLAVKHATEESSGRDTAGVDGVRSMSDRQKLNLAQSLRLDQMPKPLRRVYVDKPGSHERRPIGIPTLADRAFQQLIVLALEPEWEATFTHGTFGYRKGRGCHDALKRIQQRLQNSPQWVLDADIEKFFDRLSHDATLKKLDTFTGMETAIRRTLKSGVLVGLTLERTEQGTPQGGPLSPLLANIALCGLERDLHEALGQGTFGLGKSIPRSLCLVMYADDLVVLHKDQAKVQKAKQFIEDWIRPLGLNLHPDKTRIVHTLEKDGQHGLAGFDYLGCHIQQFRVRKTSVPAFYKGLYTHIWPSKKSIRKLLVRLDEALAKLRPRKHRNASYQLSKSQGKDGPFAVLIHHLNRVLIGWANYHRYHNSKDTFSKVDNLVFWKLWRWMLKVHPHAKRHDLEKKWFKSKGQWCFNAPGSGEEESVKLERLADTQILTHIPLLSKKSYFDGDWVYWAGRNGDYPGLPSQVARLLKSQIGKCWSCHKRFGPSDQPRPVVVSVETCLGAKTVLVHPQCTANCSIALPGEDSSGSVPSSPVH